MPHVIVKLYKGRPDEVKMQLANKMVVLSKDASPC